MIPAWSYSSIKTFDQCPKKYYHLKVVKDFKDEDSTATIYGKELHTAAEEFIRDGTPIPAKFSFLADTLKALSEIPGDKQCEIKLGVAKNEGRFTPCDFFDKNVWWRGIADLLIINEETGVAHLIDYKTSKNAKYADPKQLDLLAGAVFLKYPKIVEIKAALLFVVCNDIVKKRYETLQTMALMRTMDNELARLEVAMKTQVWNPISGPLCKFCPVTECSHNRKP